MRGAQFTASTARTEAAVVALLAKHRGPERAATWDQLARESGIGRSVLRTVATKHDGVKWLLGVIDREDADGEPHGVFLCENAEQAARYAAGHTALVRRRATTELQRAQRRDDFAAALALWPARQTEMDFGRVA